MTILKSKYETHVLPHLDKISEMCLTMTERQIAKVLGVSYASFNNYKSKHLELLEHLKKGRLELALELKSILIQKAKGFQYEDKKIILDANGNVDHEEKYIRTIPPDLSSIHLLLKNIDQDWRNDDFETMRLKKRQVDIAQQKADDQTW